MEHTPKPVKISPTYRIEEFIIPTVIAFAVISSLVIVIYAMNKSNSTNSTDVTSAITTPIPTLDTTDAFEIKVLTEGSGEGAKVGQKVTVHYTGTFKTTGEKFDSSKDAGREPFSFTLGENSVIQGWEQGVLGMKVGEKRKLQVPPAMGYGASDYMSIPGNSTLIFEVELLSIN